MNEDSPSVEFFDEGKACSTYTRYGEGNSVSRAVMRFP
jgi:hypothetical protein